MMKRYVLDTNVLMHDPNALHNFEDNEIFLPLEVIVELDKFKRGTDERNVNARRAIRQIEELTQKGIPKEGIKLENAGTLFFMLPKQDELFESLSGYADDRILKKTSELSLKEPDISTCLVTKDINLRIRARAIGLDAADYLHDKAAIDLHAFFKQNPEFMVPKKLIDELFQEGKSDATNLPEEYQALLQPNQYLVLKYNSSSALVRHMHGELVRLTARPRGVARIRPRNHSQHFLLDACMDPEITIVSALGKAGTGKTLLAIAAGLEQIRTGDRPLYHKIIVFRSLLEAGKEIGFLPGEVKDKIEPFFKPVETALEFIGGEAMAQYEEKKNYINYCPINFVRGDTFHNSYIIVDDAQNFTRQEIKTIGSRMGSNSKMLILGDPFQIDNPYLDEKSNGAVVVTDSFRKNVDRFAYVILDKVERSEEAAFFTDYL